MAASIELPAWALMRWRFAGHNIGFGSGSISAATPGLAALLAAAVSGSISSSLDYREALRARAAVRETDVRGPTNTVATTAPA
jgi:hypothetical protein